ncbi:hypothetical protein Q3304_08840 [Clostridioides sp. GD02377]|uniref:hypothetical protein n=1 Tax=unclassified Clostridioides TaxID=2635829 RepID=UPI0038ABD30F
MKKNLNTLKALVFISVSVLFISLYNNIHKDTENNLLNSSLEIGNIIKDFYNGEDTLNQLVNNPSIDLKVLDKINNYNLKLKTLNNKELNLTEYYNTVFKESDIEESEGTPVIDDIVEEQTESYPSEPQIDNDKNIYTTANGQNFIKINDIDILDDSYATLAYKNKWLVIPINQIPLTYDRIIDSSNYKYKLKTYENNKKDKSIKIIYVSKLDIDNKLIIEVFYKNKNLTDIKILDNL